HIAFASGFTSIRQCNETIQQVFANTPSELRSRMSKGASRNQQDWSAQGIRLRLAGRRPFSPESVLQFLAVRAVTGIEAVDGSSYRRSLRLPHGHGVVRLTPGESGDEGPVFVDAELHLSDLRDLTTAVSRCRQLLDLDADPVAVLMALGSDPFIGALVTNDPGRRVPGAVDGFELAVRAIIGQQVSVAGARTVAGRLVLAAGEALPEASGQITHLFPTPSALLRLANDDPGAFSMPTSRRRALVALAHAMDNGDVVIDPGTDPTELRQALMALPGIGPWTAEYVAMRALRDPDAFMPTDLGIKRAVETLGLPLDATQLSTLTDNWRPWRSYAMAHLWSIPVSPTPKKDRKTK
ncbi:MAG: DNA-3-methyladenine glycosylase family protein, partial [Acidimicrobiales bacterium]